MTAYIPAFVSEFPDQHVTDCVPSAALMVANKVTHNRYPASVAEREALQVAMGTQDQGATAQQAQAGLRKLLDLTVPLVNERTAMLAALTDPSRGLLAIGSYRTLPPAIRAHGRQATFDGLHAIYLGGLGGGRVIVGDPLGSTMGPEASIADVTPYLQSTTYAGLVGSEQARIVGYRLVMRGGAFTAWHVARWTHILYGPRTSTFSAGSWAPVAHGSPGFWLVTAGPDAGLYAVNGRSQVFDIQAVYSDGSRRPVPAGS